MTIAVAVIDDNRLVREAITVLLSELPDMRVFASAAADASFLAEVRPNVVLLDVGLPDEDAVRVAARINSSAPEAKVVVMDLAPTSEDVREFENVGVWAFVLKDANFDEFVDTIRVVAEGRRVPPPRHTNSVLALIAKTAVT